MAKTEAGKATSQRRRYRVYILRSWLEEGATESTTAWRFNLEDPQTRQRRGFLSLEALMRFLADGLKEEMCERKKGG